jgi:hypothetical protein
MNAPVNLIVGVIKNCEKKFKDRTCRKKTTIFYAAVIKDFFEKKIEYDIKQ